ncbi:DctP family TRAP transporter solute-binding subunit [Belnapia sp. T6]|uniref:DctP family TRAP transporter solute-binding subunit n=1 Tax=Belnapia mucosa TaxID=2804532 RepID=A0ABS1V2J9_9PROT|nr:DctP family TRAP transporter solute-binding subunit [Belnapia mucosa]MBL6455926.1 DctP family TRAP transporter solute-binding subunit [Belnapia mucosa]
MPISRRSLALAAPALLLGRAAAGQTRLRLAHTLQPTHSWNIAAEGFAREANERSNGRLSVQVFPGGQLGAARQVLEGLQTGTVELTIVGSSDLNSFEARMGIVEMPYAWLSREQAFSALEGPLGDALAKLLDGRGMTHLGLWENGLRHVTNRRQPIRLPADLRGLKIRTPPDRVRVDTFRALGAEPAPLAFGELYSALQQGLFDAQENPLSIVFTSSFFEVQKYMSYTGHVWGGAHLLAAKRVHDRLAPPDRALLAELGRKWGVAQRKMIEESDAEFAAKLSERGMQFNEVDKPAFQRAVQPIWAQYEQAFGPEIMALYRRATA